MKILRNLAVTLAAAAAVIACSSAPPSSSEEATATTSSELATCKPACTNAWTDCRTLPNKNTTVTSCQACGAQDQVPCDSTGPNQGCQIPLNSVGGVCGVCGMAAGQPACDGGWCDPWNPNTGVNGIPMQPLDVANGVCRNCGNLGQPECHVGGSLFCNQGVSVSGMCIPCDVGQQSTWLCAANFCNDNTCQPGVVTYCPGDGHSAASVRCTDGCGAHGGVNHSLGCSIQQ